MCGIAGFLNQNTSWSPEAAQDVLKNMGMQIAHRGPDDAANWFEPDMQLGFSHRRLAIVDLSPAGKQPMQSASGRYMIVYNGEIYNHIEIRNILEREGYSKNWRGHSDTETLLAGIEQWGLEECIQKCIGMFAVAVADLQEKKLYLVRDRIGEKPLYYGWQEKSFIFASELKAFRSHPAFRGQINPQVLPLYLKYNYIPAPYSIYKNIHKLEAGCILELSLTDFSSKVSRYWSAQSALSEVLTGKSQTEPVEGVVDSLEKLLKDAISKQMMADVPLGAFLSGGVDSSTIVALMQSQSQRPVKTFSIGFDEKNYNEAEHAKAVARHLKTEHTELYVKSREAQDVIPLLPSLYDEPFADSSQIPTYLVSKMTRKHVTVALSGDAGDELFCGYSRYQMTKKIWSKVSVAPLFMRKQMAHILTMLSPGQWNLIMAPLGLTQERNIGDKIHKGAGALSSRSTLDLYQYFITHFSNPNSILAGDSTGSVKDTETVGLPGLGDIETMMLNDLLHYLPDDILVKVDRAAMGVSLEARVPFLDHRVVEFAARLPLEYKIRDGESKWILRQILYKYVPREMIERPKMGFGIPLDVWLRGPLREWAESLINIKKLSEDGFFNPQAVNKLWSEHVSGKRNWAYHLWDVLMFQAWLEQQR